MIWGSYCAISFSSPDHLSLVLQVVRPCMKFCTESNLARQWEGKSILRMSVRRRLGSKYHWERLAPSDGHRHDFRKLYDSRAGLKDGHGAIENPILSNAHQGHFAPRCLIKKRRWRKITFTKAYDHKVHRSVHIPSGLLVDGRHGHGTSLTVCHWILRTECGSSRDSRGWSADACNPKQTFALSN